MAGASSQGKWEVSSVMEKEIKDLWSVGYLTADIKHMLPPEGQVIPTSEPGKQVV